MSKKTLITMLDADGCIYNNIYEYLLLHIIYKFGDDTSTPNPKDYVDKLISEIKSEADKGFPAFRDSDQLLQLKKDVIRKYATEAERKELFKNPAPPPDSYTPFYLRIINSFLSAFPHLGDHAKRFHKELLFAANRPLFNAIKEKMLAEKFSKLVVTSSSSRHTPELDLSNSRGNGTGLFKKDLPLLQEKFKEELAKDKLSCEFDAFNFNDHVYEEERKFFDETKLTVHYAHFHHHASKNDVKKAKQDDVKNKAKSEKKEKEEFTIISVDDRTDIQNALVKFLTANQDFIPKLNVEFWPYDGCFINPKALAISSKETKFEKVLASYDKTVSAIQNKNMKAEMKNGKAKEEQDFIFAFKGKGKNDPLFAKNVRNMACVCDEYEGSTAALKKIDVATQLDAVKLKKIRAQLKVVEPLKVAASKVDHPGLRLFNSMEESSTQRTTSTPVFPLRKH